MDAQEHVLGKVFSLGTIRKRPRDHREHQVLVSIDKFLEGSDFAATAAFDELALVVGLHQPMLIRVGGRRECFTAHSETIRKAH